MRENITDMIQQSATSVKKAINKLLESRISSQTRALMTKRREMMEHGEHKQALTEHAETCKARKTESKGGHRDV